MSLQNRFYYPFDTRKKKNSLKMLKEKEKTTLKEKEKTMLKENELETFQCQD